MFAVCVATEAVFRATLTVFLATALAASSVVDDKAVAVFETTETVVSATLAVVEANFLQAGYHGEC